LCVRLPYTVGLVITGIGLALARVETETTLTHDFIFDVILPPLLFEAALSLHWAELRRDALPVFDASDPWRLSGNVRSLHRRSCRPNALGRPMASFVIPAASGQGRAL